jgi:hypothetical protein
VEKNEDKVLKENIVKDTIKNDQKKAEKSM